MKIKKFIEGIKKLADSHKTDRGIIGLILLELEVSLSPTEYLKFQDEIYKLHKYMRGFLNEI